MSQEGAGILRAAWPGGLGVLSEEGHRLAVWWAHIQREGGKWKHQGCDGVQPSRLASGALRFIVHLPFHEPVLRHVFG